MLNEILLLSKNDIPFIQARLSIHQPTIKEIAYIGEDSFYSGCGVLNFSKEKYLTEEDNFHLDKQTNFDILMSILKSNSKELQINKINALMVLALLFPAYTINIRDEIVLTLNEEEFYLNNQNYEEFKSILVQMFCLNKTTSSEMDYNPNGELAKKIAAKLKKGREKASQAKAGNKISILSRYISILTVGEKKDMNELMQYTIYQLFDEYDRFCLKINYDMYVKAKLAGAKDIKEVDDWMKDIHS